MDMMTFGDEFEALAAADFATSCGCKCKRIKLADGWLVIAYF